MCAEASWWPVGMTTGRKVGTVEGDRPGAGGLPREAVRAVEEAWTGKDPDLATRRRQLEEDLDRMSGLALVALKSAMRVLALDGNGKGSLPTAGLDTIGALELGIERSGYGLLESGAPLGPDGVRAVMTALKLSHELERIAGLACEIVEKMVGAGDERRAAPPSAFADLANRSHWLVLTALDAYRTRNAALALQVIAGAAEGERLWDGAYRQLRDGHVVRHGQVSAPGVALLLASRYLKRIGDHAGNIAEDVIYLLEERLVKHRPASPASPGC